MGYIPRRIPLPNYTRLPLYVVHDLRAHHARRYVAISHVRSQGLCPCVKISRLQSLVNRLNPSIPEPVPFWIDTLCTAPGQYLALEAWYNVFQACGRNHCARIFGMQYPNALGGAEYDRDQRLWTIREGAIAKSLKIQFKDSASDTLEMTPNPRPLALLAHLLILCVKNAPDPCKKWLGFGSS